jgi:diaminopimelate epimerase
MRFSKWHALGNAYLLVERGERTLDADLVRRLCDAHVGVGSDGVLEVAADGAEADVSVWNPDGSIAEFSGNGARIVAAWLAAERGETDVRLRFGERVVPARVDGGGVEIDLGPVTVGEQEDLDLQIERVAFVPVDVGNPHAVVRRDAFGDLDVVRLGELIESHVRFPARTNVQLVRPVDAHRIRVGVWERGAGMTRSSGSSAVAAAAAAVANGWAESPVTVELPGGELTVEIGDTGTILRGPVERICVGDVSPLS